ncbi:MAG: 50S ribosomal protein L24 [Candidatus Methanomethylophilaceae archaeon]|jgi:large subunit ribosomal protein L24|nr:50S ribosomal protein L24 [Candidatus Methanomethylophilaceae archaeon]MBP5394934.1 50S ribosomal protein L24 [Candidatus Methanomethylophilaceae archaeon]
MVSSKARVQRYNQANAPLHVKRKMLSAHLSADLRKEYGKRSARVCKGDTVTIVRGNEDIRGLEGKVIAVDTQTGRVAVEGVTINKADGSAEVRPIHASNLVIVKLNLDDAWRKEALSRKEAKE